MIRGSWDYIEFLQAVKKNDYLKSIRYIENTDNINDDLGLEEKNYLHIAAEYGRDTVIINLIDAGANVNAVDYQGNTPLMVAARLENIDVANTLIHAGSSVNARNKDGMTALQFAVFSAKSLMVKVLFDHGADASTITECGKNILFSAALSFDLPWFENILYHEKLEGVNIHSTDKNGINIFQYMLSVVVSFRNISIKKYLEFCHFFIDNGLNFNTEDNVKGYNTLEHAIISNRLAIAINLCPLNTKSFDVMKTGLLTNELYEERHALEYLEKQDKLSKSELYWCNISDTPYDSENTKIKINDAIKDCARAIFGLSSTERAKVIFKLKLVRLNTGFQDICSYVISLMKLTTPEIVIRCFEFLGVSFVVNTRFTIFPKDLEVFRMKNLKESIDPETSSAILDNSLSHLHLNDKDILIKGVSDISKSFSTL